ncbi:unnamed protein product [Protopolystoma xenopodis]|uniref:Uncharacterized protein n=1 Tax=Protopolystoma xenopodis TaxID=117903 RepID=A0A3S5BGL1_9PLAT|nr:unnamed protein product [Protopolystoma xenopodis]
MDFSPTSFNHSAAGLGNSPSLFRASGLRTLTSALTVQAIGSLDGEALVDPIAYDLMNTPAGHLAECRSITRRQRAYRTFFTCMEVR